MKKEYVIIVLMHFTLMAIGQLSTDTSWLVMNNLGKIGLDSSNRNKYQHGNNISGPLFTISGVSLPDRQGPPKSDVRSKNDLFIIYNDWNHFNSRSKGNHTYSPSNDPFYQYPLVNPTQTEHYFASPSLPIQSMYLTKLYEKDNPPGTVRVQGGIPQNSSSQYSVGISNPDELFTANHNVVPGDDITLIVHNSGLQPGDSIFFNLIRTNIGDFTGTFFDTSNIFQIGNQSYYSNLSFVTYRGQYLILNALPPASSHPYLYFNLRGNENLLPFLNGGENGYSYANAVFTLHPAKNRALQPLQGPLVESVWAAYDPNSIRVVSVCQTDQKTKFVKYHIEFENQGNTNAHNISITLTLPSYLDPKCISMDEWYAGGKKITSGTITPGLRGTLKFTFPSSISIPPPDPNHIYASTGGVTFCIRIDPSRDLEDYRTKLNFTNPRVHFDNNTFPIETFIDLCPLQDHIHGTDSPGSVVTSKRPLSNGECGCHCPKKMRGKGKRPMDH